MGKQIWEESPKKNVFCFTPPFKQKNQILILIDVIIYKNQEATYLIKYKSKSDLFE